ncbi:MAG: YihY family inner membrane protein [Acidobacteria bacterium]|nr:YihY family inner membrane protein [Acidobacteriota bacterium]NIO58830.1 YihY family inner membrane protein [Acidobacteriota bacterium]NIQ84611.1 YihY family inner membrane protein [Acidobacteriota bacterium]NIT12425.1 YihY family inner membrane protein [Acidobacteriota bacterium]
MRGLGKDLLRVLPRFRRHSGLHFCAGVSFYALLSLPPLLYLAFATLGLVLRDPDVTERVLANLEPLFPGSAGESLRELALDMRTDNPLVLVAVPALVWVSTTVFASLELAINVAFERLPRRTVVLARLKSFALVFVGMIALLASLVAATVIPRLERMLLEANVLAEGTRLAGSVSRFLIIVAPWVLFATFYKVLPRGYVRWRSAGQGALLALLLWEAARRIFGLVLVRSPALGLLSGTLSATVSVLLWVYASVALVLLGAEFAALRHERIEKALNRPESPD